MLSRGSGSDKLGDVFVPWARPQASGVVGAWLLPGSVFGRRFCGSTVWTSSYEALSSRGEAVALATSGGEVPHGYQRVGRIPHSIYSTNPFLSARRKMVATKSGFLA